MIRINQTVLLGCTVAALSLTSIAFADEKAPAPAKPETHEKEIVCVLPTDPKEANSPAAKPNIKKMTAAECEKAGGKAAVPHAMPHGAPKPKD